RPGPRLGPGCPVRLRAQSAAGPGPRAHAVLPRPARVHLRRARPHPSLPASRHRAPRLLCRQPRADRLRGGRRGEGLLAGGGRAAPGANDVLSMAGQNVPHDRRDRQRRPADRAGARRPGRPTDRPGGVARAGQRRQGAVAATAHAGAHHRRSRRRLLRRSAAHHPGRGAVARSRALEPGAVHRPGHGPLLGRKEGSGGPSPAAPGGGRGAHRRGKRRLIPLSLTLRNFLSYGAESQTLDFRGQHVLCLSGDNGHGKSALLDAMTWALFGRARANTDDELLHHGANEMHVVLDLALNGLTYRISRLRTSKGKTRLTYLDLQIAEPDGAWRSLNGNSVRETERAIEQLLGMNYQTFINSAFLLQGRADEFT